MSFDAASIIPLLPYATLGLVIALVIWFIWLEARIKRLLRGKNTQSIEQSLIVIQKDLDQLIAFREKTENSLENIDKRLAKSVQGVGIVRFNPFKGTSGSNQSFSAAFLDAEGNGVVISSLYSRDRVSVFAKPIQSGKSEYELTDEEREAIARAGGSANPKS